MGLKPNEPQLFESAPWDSEHPIGRRRPKDIWKRIQYVHRYGVFWAPTRMDPWTYRDLLRDLDQVCLRMLKAHGALTARELAESLNRGRLLRTKPKKTGIHQITAATAHGWLDFASRRGLLSAWSTSDRRSVYRRMHWELSEQGREALRSKFWVFLELSYRSFPAVIASSILLGILKWFAVHPSAAVWILFACLLILEVAVLALFTIRSEKREAPGVAVVAIETLRSTGKTLPSL